MEGEMVMDNPLKNKIKFGTQSDELPEELALKCN
jgi:hypothetical protein